MGIQTALATDTTHTGLQLDLTADTDHLNPRWLVRCGVFHAALRLQAIIADYLD